MTGTFTNYIDTANFDVSNAGNITVATSQGLDCNAASCTVNLGATNATTIGIGTSNNTKTINIGTGTGVDTINIATGDNAAEVVTFGSLDVVAPKTFIFRSATGFSTSAVDMLTLDFRI